MKNFTKLYSVQKTLRFELIPQGKTIDNIVKNSFLEADEYKAEAYQQVKKIIDNYHKLFIDQTLTSVSLDWSVLASAIYVFRKDKSDASKKLMEKEQTNMRKQIIDLFNNQSVFEYLFSKKLFSHVLPLYLEDNSSEKELIAVFDKFSTYFQGFFDNRKNIYSDKAIATSIAYRLVHENFPKFLDNIDVFVKIQQEMPLYKIVEEVTSLAGGCLLEDVFKVSYFNCLLSQKGIDHYNMLIGGVAAEVGTHKIRGVNEICNNYKQVNKDFPKLRMSLLYKQILSDRETTSFVAEDFKEDAQVVDAIKNLCLDHYCCFIKDGKKVNICSEIKDLIHNIDSCNPSKIYITAKDLPAFSTSLTGKWSLLGTAIEEYAQQKLEKKEWKKKDFKTYLKKSVYSLEELSNIYVSENSDTLIDLLKNKTDLLIAAIYDQLYLFEHTDFTNLTIPIREDANKTDLIKSLLDSIQNLLHLLKSFVVEDSLDKDQMFYPDFDVFYKEILLILPLYNKVRSHITKKITDAKKFKLNFQTPTLANGWDLNKETANLCILLIKENEYYLGVFNAKNKPVFECPAANNQNGYQKMIYKLLPGPNKMLPKVFFSSKGLASFNPPKYILDGYKAGFHKSGANFDIAFCHQLIDFFKFGISQHNDWSKFPFQFSRTSSYQNISQFYKEVADQGYKLSFQNISPAYIDELVEKDQLYLFQIYNKDFAQGAKGKKNLHTLYWVQLFTDKNLKDIVVMLNGEAELFYRKKVINKPIVHRMGEKLLNKKDVNQKPIPDTIYRELFLYVNQRLKEPLSQEAESYLDKITIKDVTHEIIKDKRFTGNKFLFHVPITMNFKADGAVCMNEKVQKYLGNNHDVNIIGLDRGERHLLYLTVINQRGTILEKKSFNTVNDVDYHEKLNQREIERDKARKSWASIGKIKELKEGYLSIIIHEIVMLMERYNAIVVLEDLNFGFKRGRFKVEKQVYQKFEKMLIDKLNYCVDKNKQPLEPGGVLNAYQWTNRFDSFKTMGKQTGFLFYVPAGYTSKIDPTTGFSNLFQTKRITNTEQRKKFVVSFSSIVYCGDHFELDFDYDKFNVVKTDFKKKWTLTSAGERICYNSKERTYFKINPTEEIKKALLSKGWKEEEGNVLDFISSIDDSITNAPFFDKLFQSIMSILQLRNSNSAGEDYILSPVLLNGKQYDSRLADDSLPDNADANGAYHIALKGLYLLKEVFDQGKTDLKISDEQWFKFVQERRFV